jgi:hypothetical protein
MKTLIFLGLAAVSALWVAGGLAGDWTNDWGIATVVMLVIALPLIRFRFFTRKYLDVPLEFRGAPIGMGTVTAVTRTGRSKHGQPELDIRLQVDTADGRTFPATLRQVVDLADLTAVQHDAIVPVRYLTDGRVALTTDAPAYELQAALDRVYVAKGWLTPKQLRIIEHGVEAKAIILEATPTGPTQDGRNGVRLRMLVTRPNGTTFELTQEKRLLPTSISQVRPGMTVRAQYLPHDESDVAVITAVQP